jgi:endo-1,4-beta-xylanase
MFLVNGYLKFSFSINNINTKTKIMKNKLLFCLPVFIFALSFSSCKKKELVYETNFPNATGTDGTLKAATDVNIGVAIDQTPTTTNPAYMTIVKNEFDEVTFSYNMKHGAVVQSNGSLNFSTTDAMVSACGPSLNIFGHALGWHENQNAEYLKQYANLVASSGPELLQDAGFENVNGTGGPANWYTYNSGNPAGTSTITSTTSDVHSGTRSMKVVNPIGYGGDQWRVQIASDAVPTIPGVSYAVSYWVKATGAGGSIRLSTQDNTGGAQYQGDENIGTSWQLVTWSFTGGVGANSTRIFLDMGRAANTYFVDDASIKGNVPVNSDPIAVAKKLDTALNNFVTGMVNKYKSRVRAWDVINELFANDGSLRNNANSANGANDLFVWSNYMGDDFALKAFKYAALADPTATLFINDYGLENNSTKLTALINYVKWLKTQGAKVDGIGTQMHINMYTRHDGIDEMMQKLAATGLKIRISELDVTTNIDNKIPYVLTPLDAFGQEEMYRYVINSYRKYIPKAQQFGITIWGLHDTSSWLYNNGKQYPLLFNGDFSKKSTYAAVLAALK